MPSTADACMRWGWRAASCSMLLVVLVHTVQASAIGPTFTTSKPKDKATGHIMQRQQQHASLHMVSKRLMHAQTAGSTALHSIERGTAVGLAAVQAAARTAVWRRVMRATANITQAGAQHPEVVGESSNWHASNGEPLEKETQHNHNSSSSQSQPVAATKVAASSSRNPDTAANSRNEAGALPMDITPAAGSTGPGSGSTSASRSTALYDRQVLGSSTANHGVIYQAYNASGSAPLPAGMSEQSIDAQQSPAPGSDPPPYVFPAPTRYRTVYFMATLHTVAGGTVGQAAGKTVGQNVSFTAAEQAAFGAAVNAFLTSDPAGHVAKTKLLSIVSVPVGVRLAVGVEVLNGDANIQHFLSETVNSDPNMVWPTSIWGKITTAMVSEQNPTGLDAMQYSWFVEQYSNCSKLCGGGVQTREVLCKESSSSEAVDPAYCAHTPAPPRSRPCQEQPCQTSLPTGFTLVLGDWGACNSTCGRGSRTRSAMCVSKEGFIGSLLDCLAPDAVAGLWEELWQPCTQLPSCPTYFWSYSDWICNNTSGCGGGIATRTATCLQADTHSEVDDLFCDPEDLDTSTQACATNPCHVYYWRSRELGDCLPEEASLPCGRYVQRRVFDCINMTSGEGANNQMCSGPKPELGDVECQGPANCTEGAPSTPEPVTIDISSATSSDTGYINHQAGGSGSSSSAGSEGPASADSATPAAATTSAAGGGFGSTGSGSSSSSAGSGASSVDAGGFSTASGTIATDKPDKPTQPQVPAEEPGTFSMSQGVNVGANAGGSSTASPNAAASGSSSTAGNAGSSSAAVSTTTTAAAAAAASPSPQAGLSEAESQPGSTAGANSGSSNVPSAANSGSTSLSSVSAQGGGLPGPMVFDLGPGQTLPEWLLQTPTATLQALLDCPKKYAISVDGKCCGGKQLDSKGICCDGVVDACGACNGNGKAIDALGTCCPGVLDAKGICCLSTVDECGVCNGTNSCDLKAELTAALPSPSVYLAPNSPSNRRLRITIEDAVAKAITTVSGRNFYKGRVSATLSAYTPVAPVGQPTAVQANTNPNGATRASEYTAPQQSNIAPAAWAPVIVDIPSTGTGYAAVSAKAADKLEWPASSSSGEQKPRPAALAADSAVPPLNSFNTYTITSMPPISPAGPTSNVSSQLIEPTNSSISAATSSEPVRALAEETLLHEPPVQLDTLLPDGQAAGPNTIQANTMQPNRTRYNSGRQPGVENDSTWYQIERATERTLHTSFDGVQMLVNGVLESGSSDSVSNSSSNVPASAGGSVVPPVATSSNTIVISLTVQTVAGMASVDTGLALLALNVLAGKPVPVPSSSSKLTVRQIKSVVRQGKCGDGVCQVGERPAYGNANQCPADCVLAFMSCPLGTDSQLCSGRGICFNSVGSCSCTAGYSGADCSACALNHKMVNGYCVSGPLLAPPRLGSTDLATGDNMLKQVTNLQQSLLGGKLAVTLVTVLSMALVAYAARIVYNKRRDVINQRVGEQETAKADNYVAD